MKPRLPRNDRRRGRGVAPPLRFGQMLRALRRAQNITLETLAEKTGLNITALSFVENNRQRPPEIFPYVLHLAELLEIPPDSKEYQEFFQAAARERFDDSEVTSELVRALLGTIAQQPGQASTDSRLAHVRAERKRKAKGKRPGTVSSPGIVTRSYHYEKSSVLEALYGAFGAAMTKGAHCIAVRTHDFEEHSFYVAEGD